MHLNFDVLFKPIITALKRNASYPFYEKNGKWFIKFLALQGIYVVFFVLLIYNMVVYGIMRKDLIRFCGDGTYFLINIVITFKYGVLLVHQEVFRNIMNLMKVDYEYAKKLPAEERNVVLKYADRGHFVTIWWCRIVFIGGSVIIGQAVVLTIYSAIIGDFHLVDLYPLQFPLLADDSMERFIVVNLIYGYGVWYSCVMYNGFVPLGPVFMLHASGQLAILEIRSKTLFPDIGFSPVETRKKIRDIAKRLRDIYDFVECIQIAFQGLYDITLTSTAYMLPMLATSIVQAARAMELPPGNPVTVFIAAVLYGSFPCYFSDKLLEHSDSFREAIYNCGWEKCFDRPSRITLLVILTRTSRPMVIRTMFRVVCLDTLASVFKEAYTIFSLILTII